MNLLAGALRGSQKPGSHLPTNPTAGQAALCRLTNRLCQAEGPTEACEAALDAIVAVLGCDGASISLCDDNGVMRLAADRRAPGQRGASPASRSPWTSADHDPRPIWISDLRSLRKSAPARNPGSRSLAFLPILTEGALVGQIMAEDPAPHDFAPVDIELATAVAGQLGLWIGRRRAQDRLVRTEETLRENETRLDSAFEHAGLGMVVMDRSCHIVSTNSAFCRITGRDRDALVGETCLDFTHPDDIPGNLRVVRELENSPSPVAFEKRYALPAGGDNWVRMTLARAKSDQIVAVVEDIDARRRAEKALRESEELFRAIVDMTPECVKLVARDGTLLYINAAGIAMLGTNDAASVIGACLYDFAVPEDRERVREFNERICGGERLSIELAVAGIDGQIRHMESRAAPFRNSDGTIVQLALTRDITQRLRAEEQRTLLINELNHRVKNTLATVQSLALQTLRSTERSADANVLLESRLTALARAHDVLNRVNWGDADLREVVTVALDPFQVGGGRIAIDGAALNLAPNQALAISIIVHELATNATKYGALSNGRGRVKISWSRSCPDCQVKLVWEECGGPLVCIPERRGFGSRLIERNLQHELGAPASIEFHSTGVIATIGIVPRHEDAPTIPAVTA